MIFWVMFFDVVVVCVILILVGLDIKVLVICLILGVMVVLKNRV